MSVDADHDNDNEDGPTPLVTKPDGTDGATVSGHAEVAPLTDAIPETLPAASTAATPSVYDVPQVSPENEKLVEVGDPTCVPFRNTRYPATPTLSDDADHDNVNPD